VNFKISIIVLTIFILALFAFHTSTTFSQEKLLTCEVKNTPCDASEAAILKMSSLTNAHAEVTGQSNYGYYICCSGLLSLRNDCSDNSTTSVLSLSNVTNAHVEKKDLGNYLEEVCISSPGSFIFECDYDSDCANLGSEYECLASISGDTNAHIGDCLAYSTKICCEASLKNQSPNAKFSCNPSNCTAYSGSSNPILKLENNSTDPDGIDDIATSSWDIGVSGHELVCSGICDYTVQTASLPADEYQARLTVIDQAGASDTVMKIITIRQDVIADFECSSNEDGPWQNCSEFRGVQKEYAYFKDISTVSEGANFISSRTWELNGEVFDSGIGVDPVPLTRAELVEISNTVKLSVEDNKSRQDTVSYTFGARLPLPTWQEIAP